MDICKIEYNATVQISRLELQIATKLKLKHMMMREKYSMIQFTQRVKTCKTKLYKYIYLLVHVCISIKTHKGKLNNEFRMIVTDGASELEIKSMWSVQKAR